MNIKEFESRIINLDDGLDAMIPVTHPHVGKRAPRIAQKEVILTDIVDQSFDGAVTRVRVHMGDQAEELLKRRFRIVKCVQMLEQVSLGAGL